MFAEIGERQREGGRHAQTLGDAQRREPARFGASASSAVGTARTTRLTRIPIRWSIFLLKIATTRPAYRHSERAGIDCGTHRGRADPVGARQRGQDRLGGEKVNDGEKRRQRK